MEAGVGGLRFLVFGIWGSGVLVRNYGGICWICADFRIVEKWGCQRREDAV